LLCIGTILEFIYLLLEQDLFLLIMKNRKIDNSSQLQYLFKQLSALQPSKFFPSSPDKRAYKNESI